MHGDDALVQGSDGSIPAENATSARPESFYDDVMLRRVHQDDRFESIQFGAQLAQNIKSLCGLFFEPSAYQQDIGIILERAAENILWARAKTDHFDTIVFGERFSEQLRIYRTAVGNEDTYFAMKWLGDLHVTPPSIKRSWKFSRSC